MTIVNPNKFGVTFSIKQCRNFNIDSKQTLDWLIKEAGFRRFRLMSYWNELEPIKGKLDFKELDRQISQIRKAGGVVTLCLGARQPRWPENHWPDWAWELDKSERTKALYDFIQKVVNRYKDEDCIVSYQLENEALLKSFGTRSEVDRSRLKEEYRLIKKIDHKTPVIMSTSTSWGIPIRSPIPDIVGFSYYQVVYNSKEHRYTTAFHTPLLHRTRANLIKILHKRNTFIHELQLEPWGPDAIWKMSLDEQSRSMAPVQIAKNIELAKRVKRYPIDLWGGEWWYWRLHKHKDSSIWQAVNKAITD